MKKNKKKILIAEDEKAMARVLEFKLNEAGFDTVLVYNGKDALTQLQKNKFDLLILDMIMPKMSGFDVLREINDQKIDVRIIAMSNLTQSAEMEQAKKLGAEDYFIKATIPIDGVVNHIKKKLLK